MHFESQLKYHPASRRQFDSFAFLGYYGRKYHVVFFFFLSERDLNMSETVTIADVAKRAEVSTGTVSRVLNGCSTKHQTRNRVFQAARDLGYRPELTAGSMRSARNNCMGILVEKSMGSNDPWLDNVVMVLSDFLSGANYGCMIEFWRRRDEDIPEFVDKVDGCILLGNYPESFFKTLSQRRNIPLVTFNEKLPYQNGIRIQIDWEEGMLKAVQYLLALQHEKIGLVVAGTQYPSLKARFDAFREALNHFGREVDHSLISSSEEVEPASYRTSFELTEQLLSRRPDLSAIIYSSDFAAMGGLEALRQSGYSVPEDISIMGFDNTDWGRNMVPALTSIGVDYRILAASLLEALEYLLGERRTMPVTRLKPDLFKRKTTAACNTNIGVPGSENRRPLSIAAEEGEKG